MQKGDYVLDGLNDSIDCRSIEQGIFNGGKGKKEEF
jgi:hypothetical protein